VAATVAGGRDAPARVYPYAGDDFATTTTGQSVSLNVLANDSSGAGPLDLGTLTLVGQPSGGAANLDAEGILTYSPAAGFSGDDTMTYFVCDMQETDPRSCDYATVSIRVEAPVIPTSAPTAAPTLVAATPAKDAPSTPRPPSTGSGVAGAADPSLAATLALGAGLTLALAGAAGAAIVRRRS
jgi:hypothetical protein